MVEPVKLGSLRRHGVIERWLESVNCIAVVILGTLILLEHALHQPVLVHMSDNGRSRLLDMRLPVLSRVQSFLVS